MESKLKTIKLTIKPADFTSIIISLRIQFDQIIITKMNSFKVSLNEYRQSGWLCTRWGEIAQSLNFKYLYKRHYKSNELLWISYNMVPLKSPQQFVRFTVTLVKIFKV
jgi:hypothetical protein